MDIYNKEIDSQQVIIVVGGDGDSKEYLAPFNKALSESIKMPIISFSYSMEHILTLEDMEVSTLELKEVIKESEKSFPYRKIILVLTSSGSIPSTNCILDSEVNGSIQRAIYLDPANYYTTKEGKSVMEECWKGAVEFNPIHPVISDKMKDISCGVIIDVVPFTIRNTYGNRYVEEEKRGIDHEGLYTRINVEATKAFYLSTPESNRGRYLEIDSVPHGFLRDGDISKNIETLVSTVKELC